LFAPEQPVYAIAPPIDRRHRDFVRSFEQVAAFYAHALTEFQPTGDLVIGGWSMGGPLALETAQQLMKNDSRRILLFNIDGEIFNTTGRVRRLNPVYWVRVATNIGRWIKDESPATTWSVESVRRRVSSKVTAPIVHLAKKITRNTAPNVHAVCGFIDPKTISATGLEYSAAMMAALFGYTPRRYEGPAVVYAAQVQPLLRWTQVPATWRAVTPHADIVFVSGSHRTMVKTCHARAMVEDLQRRIDRFSVSSPDHAAASGVDFTGVPSAIIWSGPYARDCGVQRS
jgi:pimeloyl-ACP methyl ester carboxylesterase